MNQSPFEEHLRDPRPVTGVLEDIVANVQEIIRSEARLATKEVQEKLAAAGKPAAMLGGGGIAAVYAVGFLLLSAVYGLSTVVEPWLAAMIVGAVMLVVAAILA